MRLLPLLLLVVLSAPAPSYGGQGRGIHSHAGVIQVADERRTFAVHRGRARGEHPPLVVALHGAGGSGRRFERVSGWDAVADRAGAIVVYPDSVGPVWRSEPGADEDVRFLSLLIARLVAREGVDPARVYVTGHSSGANMTYRMACEGSGLIAGIGPVAGAPLADCTSAPDPVRVAAWHGTADRVIPYDGGALAPSAYATALRWVRHNGCLDRSRHRHERDLFVETWPTCVDDARVRLTSVEGGRHGYPVRASAAIWAFLSR
jgi:polyhydroxybutyrate depolymerase